MPLRHFRKPEFFRDEALMNERIDDAKAIWKLISRKKFKDEILMDCYERLIEDAAKAAGFFTVKDFEKWARLEGIDLKP